MNLLLDDAPYLVGLVDKEPGLLDNLLKTQPKLLPNKCVSRTDTNPPFAFDIAFFGQGFTGFLQGYRDG